MPMQPFQSARENSTPSQGSVEDMFASPTGATQTGEPPIDSQSRVAGLGAMQSSGQQPEPSFPSPGTQFPPLRSQAPQGVTGQGPIPPRVPRQSKKSLVFIIIIALILIIGGGAFGVYWFLTSRTMTTNVLPANVNTVLTNTFKVNTNMQSNTNGASLFNANASTNATIVNSYVAPDSDQDGLIDSEELSYGTNANLADSDNDGLNDYIEIKTYKTNPIKADTDGDGYNDGTEVSGGYNPNGAGKLFSNPVSNINSAASNPNANSATGL